MNHTQRFCIRYFFIYFYINSIFCFFFLIFDRSFELSLGPVQKNYLRSMQCLHVASTGILEFILYTTIYHFCTVHSVARYSVRSILVQILRNFVPRERDFFTLTHRITESQNHTHVKVLWNRYSFADIPMIN